MTDDEPSLDGVLAAVGPRLRALRQQRNQTLAQLSEVTGITMSTLSRLESGGRRPTLELLLPLARTYHVPLDELVGAPETGDPRIHPRPMVRHGITVLPLSRRPGGIRAYKFVVPAGWPTGELEPEPQVHEGYEWMYVLDGRVRLWLAGHELDLAAGEVAEFDTRTPHLMTNPHRQPAELLLLIGPQGERAHVRARPRRPSAD